MHEAYTVGKTAYHLLQKPCKSKNNYIPDAYLAISKTSYSAAYLESLH